MSVESTTPFCCLVFWAPLYVPRRSVGLSLHLINKGKYRRNVFASYPFSIFSFCIFLLGLSLGKALRRLVNVGWNSETKIWSQISYGNTALPLALDLQKPSNPTNSSILWLQEVILEINLTNRKQFIFYRKISNRVLTLQRPINLYLLLLSKIRNLYTAVWLQITNNNDNP